MKKYGIVFLFLSFLFVSITLANPIRASHSLAELLGRYQTYRADFIATTYHSNHQMIKTTPGKIVLMRPNKFWMETLQPTKQIVIANNHTLWIYDVDLAQVTQRTLNQADPASPAQLLTGDEHALKQQFNVTQVGQHSFRLTPKNANSNFKSIHLRFDHQQLTRLILLNPFNQCTVYHFTNIQLNQNISPTIFNFIPPKNVDVLTQ